MGARANIFNLSNHYRLDAIYLYHTFSQAIGSKDSIKDVFESNRLNILNTRIGVYELKKTSNDNMWNKEITFKIIAGELLIDAQKNYQQLDYLLEIKGFSILLRLN